MVVLLFAVMLTSVAIGLNASHLAVNRFKFKKEIKTEVMAVADKKLRWAGNLIYNLYVGLLVVAAIWLWILFLTNQFSYDYVARYSSVDLSPVFRITAFWAGQEGSFLLWVLMHGLIGLALINRKKSTPGVNLVFSILQAGLLVILIVKSPFVQTLHLTEGMGLNPLLQNFWMISHPPFLFLGYAGLAVPFALAVGSLLDGDYTSWIKKALPVSLLSWACLGVGIFLGGYWAYEVLGWGGYWGWDPVENSSLIPWLASGVLVHFLILARRKQELIRPAFLAAVFCFSLALYGTFLTRSGVLMNFSQHSFSDAGLTGLMAIIIFPIIAGALILLIIRWRALPTSQEEGEEPVRTREFLTFVGMLVLGTFALVVLLGTSMPFLTSLIGSSTNVSNSYFNSFAAGLTAVMLAAMSLATFWRWGGARTGTGKEKDKKKEDKKDLTAAVRIGAAVAVAILAVVAGLVIGLRSTLLLNSLALLGLAVAGAVIALSILAFRKSFGKGMSKAALVTHLGLALLAAGVIFSSAGAEREPPLLFEAGEQKSVLGRQLTYVGSEDMPGGQGYVQKFDIDGSIVEISTRYNERYGAEHKPAIVWSLWQDYYIAPDLRNTVDTPEHFLSRNIPVTVDMGGDPLQITMKDLGMGSQDPDDPFVFVILDVARGADQELVTLELRPTDSGTAEYYTEPVEVFGAYKIHLNSVNPASGETGIYVYGINETLDDVISGFLSDLDNKIYVEVSTKPLIILVWLGTIMVSLGTIWAALLRWGPGPFRDLHNRKQKKEAIM